MLRKQPGTIRKESEVRKKLRDAKYQYLAKEYKEKLTPKPENCKHYYLHTEIDRETGEEVEVGLCMFGADNPEEWPGTICDSIEDCESYEPRYSKEEVRVKFEESLEDEMVVANTYKDIAALQWVLDEKVYSWDLAWYQRLHLWISIIIIKLTHNARR